MPNEHCTSANTLEKREPQPSTLQAHANVSKSAVGKQDGGRKGGHRYGTRREGRDRFSPSGPCRGSPRHTLRPAERVKEVGGGSFVSNDASRCSLCNLPYAKTVQMRGWRRKDTAFSPDFIPVNPSLRLSARVSAFIANELGTTACKSNNDNALPPRAVNMRVIHGGVS
jgi:hypothetical protein